MMKSVTKTRGKVFAAFAAVAAAFCMASGGIATAVYADEHTHSFSDTLTAGLRTHWYACECGTVMGLEEHNYENDTCTECGADKPDPAHIHNFDISEWDYDTLNHWHKATCHGIVKDIAKHNMQNGECTVCDYSTNSKPVTPPTGNPGSGGNTELPEEKDPVELPQNVTAAGGYNESLYAEWETSNTTGVKAYYKTVTETDWTEIDGQLIRMVDGDTARVDAVGLKAGQYNLKITSTVGSDIVVSSPITVSPYDRSGYAHFQYNTGIGAYNDDGTLKQNALVIYVTNSNKNNVKEFVYKNTANGLVKEDITQYIKPGKPASNGKDLGGESYWSIGYILNNRGYENNTEREKYGIQKLSFTYGGVAVRILDTVTSETNSKDGSPTLTGLTYYAKAGGTNPITGETYKKGVSVPNGGTVNDNGQMARITNAKNLTIEGIGESARIFGWGIHFVSNDNLHKNEGAGSSFEVRNITFESYPEDAIGMEGTQGTKVDQSTGSITGGASSADADLISPVQRCWIHNNTFLPGYCANPAESDKGEGDGSCDFKRGQYYTLAYNYFVDCHKTNLIGSADNSLSYNITMHHNWWNNCGARQPLIRRANCHFYNNYISGDMSATPKPALSYITSARANSYLFSENNYYDGCKQIVVLASGGVVKAYGNMYYACFGGSSAVEATSRTQYVSNSCKFILKNIDYSHFDTDSTLFYFNDETKQSDCLLDTATVARVRVMMYAGVNGFGKKKSETGMNNYTPANAVSVGDDGLTVDLSKVGKGSSMVSNVEFNGVSGVSSGTVKGKGQMITFTLTSETQLLVETSTTGDPAPELLGADGTVYLSKFTGSRSIVLKEGTYIIASGQKDKEATITSLSFANTSASSAERVKAAEDAIKALPATITLGDGALVVAAQQAYDALTAAEKADFDAQLVEKLNSAVKAYDLIQVNDVIEKILAIGEVDKNSYEKINAAQQAYNALTAAQQAKISAEYRGILADAQNAYAQYAVQNVIDMIENLTDVPDVSTDRDEVAALRAEYEAVKVAYDELDDGSDDDDSSENQQNKVTNIAKLTDGLKKIEQLEKLFEFEDMLDALDVSTVTISQGNALKTLYGQLTSAQQSALTAGEKEEYDAIIEKCDTLAKQSVTSTFIGGQASNEPFKVNSGSAKNEKKVINAYGGELASGLKMESGTQIEFTIATKMVLKLYVDASGNVKIGTNKVVNKNGGNKNEPQYSTVSEDGDNVVTVTLEAGTYYITKDSSFNLYYATLTPAA